MQVGIIGGTGPAGRAVAARLASVGLEVLLGSRSSDRGEEVAATLRSRWTGSELAVTGSANARAAACEVVIVATPWDGAVGTSVPLADELAGKLVISMANALARVGDEFQALVPARGSVAAALQCALPRSRVAGAFHHLPAGLLADLERPVDADVLVCADERSTRSEAISLVERIPGVRGVNAGSLSACGAIEAFTAVLVNVNVLNKVHASVRLTGIDRTDSP